jgi:isoleucyl-tRNA synthetase
LVFATGWDDLPADLRDQVSDELNVLGLESLSDITGDLVDVSAKANFRSLGARFGKQTPQVAAAIAAADAAGLAAALRAVGETTVVVDGLGPVTVTGDDVVITEAPRAGWSVVTEGGESLALDLTVDDELRRAGLAREIVRALQEGRKSAGLQVSDRIRLWWHTDDVEVAAALAEHTDQIAAEVLAVEISRRDAPSGAITVGVPAELPLVVYLQRA